MNCSIVIAKECSSGKLVCVHIGEDAEKALSVYRDDKALAAAGLRGELKVEMIRRPQHFKRRDAIAEAHKSRAK